MLLLFTTPSCPNCPQAKKWLEEKGLASTLVDASRPEGLTLARKFKLSQVPSLVDLNGEGDVRKTCLGLESISQFLKEQYLSPRSSDVFVAA